MLSELKFRRVYGPNSPVPALHDFLIPALKMSNQYSRAAGYFSSTVFAEAARGIAGLVGNDGKMRLVASHVLSEKDHAVLLSGGSEFSDWFDDIAEDFHQALSGNDSLEGRMKSDYVAAMCWMLKHDHLEIRFVVPDVTNVGVQKDYEKFHPKFGVLKDIGGNVLAFAGSVNETRLGWVANLENLSVYAGWETGVADYAEAYEEQFEDYWNGKAGEGWKTIDLPHAIKNWLVGRAPSDGFPDLSNWESTSVDDKVPVRKPRKYQLEAVKAWENAGRIGLLEMATGTGKTLTARLCVDSALTEGSLLTVVVAPYQHIADQWVKELSELDPIQIGAQGNWRSTLNSVAYEVALGAVLNLTLVVVKNTASKKDFIDATNDLADSFENFMFIGDEVHWLGAVSYQASMNPAANFRLGLSATPNRYFDQVGTDVIRDYFKGDSVYVFGLEEALSWQNADGTTGVLTPYEYHPIFVELTEIETTEYLKLSTQIAQLSVKKNKTSQDYELLEQISIKRAEIAKSAENKLPALSEILGKLGAQLKNCLIYCSNFSQMDRAMAIARMQGIDAPSRITGYEQAKKSVAFDGLSEREHILSNFAKGNLSVLFAIDCLDEGVDIPTAEIGIIMASSGNTKEFIQRRGRLMRRSLETGKSRALIYDLVVIPAPGQESVSLRRNEILRVKEFAELATNKSEIDAAIQIMEGN